MSQDIGYDKTDKYSIERYGQGMVGRTIRDICGNAPGLSSRHKGGLGVLIEEKYFGYKRNNESAPDFSEAGVELKTSPFKINQNQTVSAKERIPLTLINYMEVVQEEDFEQSHLWFKCAVLLLVYYRYEKKKNKLDMTVHFVQLFTPNEQDLAIIRNDYNIIVTKIKNGKAHELSESDTLYLSAATKGKNASAVRRQPCSNIPAKQRAFSYKTTYMTYILRTVICGNETVERILHGAVVDDFEGYVLKKLNQFQGKSIEYLMNKYGITKKPKNLGAILAYRMLGIKGNKAEEFVKAGVTIKTITREVTGTIKQSMRFCDLYYEDILFQEWEDSDFFSQLSKKFLFIIFQKTNDGDIVFSEAKFWNLPESILNSKVKDVWETTKNILENIEEVKEIHNGTHYIGIFPKMSFNGISHVRPHAQNSQCVRLLPDGREYPRQCFWLNNSYILSVIDEK